MPYGLYNDVEALPNNTTCGYIAVRRARVQSTVIVLKPAPAAPQTGISMHRRHCAARDVRERSEFLIELIFGAGAIR